MNKKPNVVFVFSDQHRAEACGYAGNKEVLTPFMDSLAQKSIMFKTAVANAPVCSPYRATLMTGQYPLTHGVFLNDASIGSNPVYLAQAFKQAGYDTSYIGKWHIDGLGRKTYIPKERRKGFDYWRVMECTHDYNESYYYDEEGNLLEWDGYDAEAQTRCAQEYIRHQSPDKPFLMMLSWGPPHDPYETAPLKFKEYYAERQLQLNPNVPKEAEDRARKDLAGYYAHISALDQYLGELWETIDQAGIAEDTIFIYTSDHGDMHGAQNHWLKQVPWDESIRVPFLLRYPARFGYEQRVIDKPFNSPHIMPTFLGLCNIEVPKTVEGINLAPFLDNLDDWPEDAV